MRDTIINLIQEKKIIAIVRGIEAEVCLKVSEALLDGGISLIEVTFDQRSDEGISNTLKAIESLDKTFGNDLYVGAGTVLNEEQVQLAAKCGAKYIISPDTKEAVIKETIKLGMVSMPGALTPTEIAYAHDCGADFVKIFPAGNLGPGYIKAVRSPLAHIKLLGVGGINAENIPEFLKAGCCGFGVGGNLVNAKWIAEGRYDLITECAKEMCAVGGVV